VDGYRRGMSDRVTWTLTDGVADVRLNRPEKMNALDGAMFEALVDVGEAIKQDDRVRAVVLSGEGRAFCAGLDFSSFQSMASGSRPADAATASDTAGGKAPIDIGDTSNRITHTGQQAAWVWQEIPVPVIAAVHGVALGGGCQIALGADLRYCTAEAQFSVLEIRWGLVPDMTGTYTLTKLVGLDVAKELTFTGRMVTGEEAVRLGLATRVCADPRSEALALAADMASKSPSALRASKRLLNMAPLADAASQFARERHEIGRLIGSPNQVESVMAFFEKRPPKFADGD
jgi:enoyl-CoA hydratase/carnithine racemase